MIKNKNKHFGVRSLCLFLCLMFIFGVFMSVTAFASSPTKNKYEGLMLIPGGQTFGVKFNMAGIMIVGFCDVDTDGGNVSPGSSSGLKTGDIITKVDGQSFSDSNDFMSLVDKSSGKNLLLTLRRGVDEKTVTVSPVLSKSEKKYKLGICVRDSGAGIGTVTYIYPKTYSFAGLGHGICSGDDGKLLPMNRGIVTDVNVCGVKRGVAGTPGEIKGIFGNQKTGTLVGNTQCGVYGMFAYCPKDVSSPIPVGTRGQVKSGKAYIMCTLDESGVGKYNIEISSVKYDERGSKCFTVKIKDQALIDKTGGIVQGMSGSPIIQDGKLIGAVTHVMINDPTVGYGIFIENMLDNMPELLR